MKRWAWALPLLVLIALVHLSLGRGVDLGALLTGAADDTSMRIFWELRVPRAIVAFMAGAALGLAGLLLQTVLRNPLAAPEMTAVNPAAVLGYLGATGLGVIDGGAVFPSVAAATIGGLVGGGLMWFAARRDTPEGAAVIGLLSALALTGVVTIALAARPTGVSGAIRWLIGSLDARVSEHIPALVLPVVVAMVLAWLIADQLDIVAVSDSHAHSLGLRPRWWRGAGIGVAVVLAAAAVAAAGPLAFVGFVAPHLVRLTLGAGLRRQVPLVVVFGGLFVLAADAVASALSLLIQQSGNGRQVGVPAGAVTSLVGAALLIAFAGRQQEGDPA